MGVEQGQIHYEGHTPKTGWMWINGAWSKVFHAARDEPMYSNTGMVSATGTITPPEWAEFVRLALWGSGGGGSGGNTAIATVGNGGAAGSLAVSPVTPVAGAIVVTTYLGGVGGAKASSGGNGGTSTATGGITLSAYRGSGGSGYGVDLGRGKGADSLQLLDGTVIPGGATVNANITGNIPGGGGGGGSGGIFGNGSPGQRGGAGAYVAEFFNASWAAENNVPLP